MFRKLQINCSFSHGCKPRNCIGPAFGVAYDSSQGKQSISWKKGSYYEESTKATSKTLYSINKLIKVIKRKYANNLVVSALNRMKLDVPKSFVTQSRSTQVERLSCA